MIIQVYKPYWMWEDYNNGMYSNSNEHKEILISKSISLLSDANLFFSISEKMVNSWHVSSLVNLTNKSQNRRAWIGAASCCFNHSCPEQITRIAWGLLNEMQRSRANYVADIIIKKYEIGHSKLHKNVAEKMLF